MRIFTENQHLDLEKDLLCKFISVLGVRGSGKSNSTAVLNENFLDYKVPMTIIDIEGEYWALKEKYEILVVGGVHKDIPFNVDNGSILAKMVLEKGIPVIIDLSEQTKEERDQFLLDYMKELWSLEHKYRKAHMITIEEAHEFIPQSVNSELKDILVKIALRGRKWGIGAIITSQRSAKVDKDILTQAEIYLLHKVTHPADYNVYRDLVGKTKKVIGEEMNNFQKGEVYFKNLDGIKRLRVKKKETFDAGFTPSLENRTKSPNLKALSNELIKAFEVATTKTNKRKNELEKLQSQLNRKIAEIMELAKENEDLKQELKIVRNIKVSFKYPTEQYIERTVINSLEAKGLSIPSTPINQIQESRSEVYDYLDKPFANEIEDLRKILASCRSLEITILKLLEADYPKQLSIRDFIRRIHNWSDSTIKGSPPKILLKSRMIIRKRGELNEYLYTSNLRTYLEDALAYYNLPKEKIDLLYRYCLKYIDYLSKQ
jgi:hypothetical protein